jgi:hypothetical protein
MPWTIGIDEAGYGPVLGPLTQVAAAACLPAGDPAGWSTLAPWVRRHAERDKTRHPIDDSKLVHSGPHGLKRLEAALAAFVGLRETTLGGWLGEVALPHVVTDLQGEAWFDAAEALPLHDAPPDLRPAVAGVGVELRVVAVKLVPAPVFNQIVAGSGTKATVLAIGLTGLLGAILGRLPGDDPVRVLCDKQGGRNFYGPILRAAFPGATVTCEAETAAESRYRVTGLARELAVEFRPRADGECVAVALASMAAKYLREVTMRQFNRHWQTHLAGLKATAGYPVDGERFYAEILPLLPGLNLTPDQVRRSR